MSRKHVAKWIDYRDTRQGTYEYRARTRYKDVADRLFILGLKNGDTVVDVGAGECQFGRYLSERGWDGNYVPVDAVVNGVDLERYEVQPGDFVVAIEVVEHLHRPTRLIASMLRAARLGVVLTTPNDEVVDCIACDPTHVSVVTPEDLHLRNFFVEYPSWFGVPNDSLLAWRRA